MIGIRDWVGSGWGGFDRRALEEACGKSGPLFNADRTLSPALPSSSGLDLQCWGLGSEVVQTNKYSTEHGYNLYGQKGPRMDYRYCLVLVTCGVLGCLQGIHWMRMSRGNSCRVVTIVQRPIGSAFTLIMAVIYCYILNNKTSSNARQKAVSPRASEAWQLVAF